MKNQIKLHVTGAAVSLALLAASLSTHAGVSATQGLGANWIGTPDIETCNPPGANSVNENEYSTSPPNPPLSLAQSFTVTNAASLTNIQIYVSGAAVTCNIHLYDLGIPGGSNPTSYSPGTDLFTSLSFSYSGGNANVLSLQFSSPDAVALVAGHQYVFEIEPASDNALTWNRSSTDTFPAGEAYRVGSLLNNVHDDFALAVTFASSAPPLPPPSTNFWVTVSAYPMTNAWPGSPMIQTFTDPSIADDFASTGVPEGFGPASDANGPGRTLGQAFVNTNRSFRLGAVTIKMRGNGGTNVAFFLSLYSLTNNAFVNTNAAGQQNRYPFNYQPSQDAAPLGGSMFGSNLVATYIPQASILPGVASGASNQLLTFNFTDPRAQVLLTSCGTTVNAGTNSIYAFEITIGTNQMLPPGGLDLTNRAGPAWTNDTAVDGLFQWIRGVSVNSTFERVIYSDPIFGAGRFRNQNGVSFAASPRAYSSSSYTNFNGDVDLSPSDPRAVRGLIAGDIRDMVMAVYAAPPLLAGATRSGNSFVLSWVPGIDGATFSVLKKAHLTDATWTLLTTNYPVGGVPISSSGSYTDATANASAGFYRVTSP